MTFIDTTKDFGRAQVAEAAGAMPREIGFMVAALKGMLRDAGIENQICGAAALQIEVSRLTCDKELLADLMRRRHADQPISLLFVCAKHAIGANTEAFKARRQTIVDTMRDNLRASDHIYDMADGTLALAICGAKLLTGIMVAERIGMALEYQRSNRAPIRVSIGVSSAQCDEEMEEIVIKAKTAMTRAMRGGLNANDVESLNFLIS
jgi:GGDEF domain-containing protein